MDPTSPASRTSRSSPGLNSSGGGESRDLFNADYTGLPGHHRVLKPPGGGSSDIFGADNAEPRRQRNVNQLQSSTVFSAMMETVAPAKSKLNADSHCRLFGDDPSPLLPPVPHPNTHLGHSFFDDAADQAASEPPVEPQVEPTVEPTVETDGLGSYEQAARDSRRNPINHVGMTAADCSQTYNNRGRAARKTDGNPVTGEGYAIANGVKDMAAAVAAPKAAAVTNGAAKVAAPAAAPPPSAAAKGRVPPGGFSSGLW